MVDYIFLIGGLIALLVGGDILVRGSVGLAEKLNIPPLIIGLTVVSFGTSAPELFISVKAAINGAGGIAVGNVVGSNITNVMLVLGLPAVLQATRSVSSKLISRGCTWGVSKLTKSVWAVAEKAESMPIKNTVIT